MDRSDEIGGEGEGRGGGGRARAGALRSRVKEVERAGWEGGRRWERGGGKGGQRQETVFVIKGAIRGAAWKKVSLPNEPVRHGALSRMHVEPSISACAAHVIELAPSRNTTPLLTTRPCLGRCWCARVGARPNARSRISSSRSNRSISDRGFSRNLERERRRDWTDVSLATRRGKDR